MRDMLRRALRWFSAAAASTPLEIDVLKIHDLKYGITVDLDDGINVAIARGGWSQAPPNPLPGGVWGDVEEDVKLRLIQDSNALYSSLAFIAQRVEELQSPLHPDYLNPGKKVVLEAKTPDEANSRWAILSALEIDKLDPAHYRANGRSLLELHLTREGLWRGLEPGQAALTLRMYGSYTYTNDGIQFANADIGADGLLGDVEPMTIFKIRPFPGATHSNHIGVSIVHEFWPSAGSASDFTPWFWAHDIANGSPTLVNISTLASPFAGMPILPYNQCADLGVSSLFWWNIPASYSGYYSVFMVYRVEESGGTAYFTHGIPGHHEDGEIKTLTASIDPVWSIINLGTFKFPIVGNRIYGQGLVNYQGGLGLYIPATGKAVLGGFYLVPRGARTPQRVKAYATGSGTDNPITIADGDIEQVFWASAEDSDPVAQIMLNPEVPVGRFQAPAPGAGVTNRFWFLPEPVAGSDIGVLPDPQVIWSLGMDYVPRWKYLNQEGV